MRWSTEQYVVELSDEESPTTFRRSHSPQGREYLFDPARFHPCALHSLAAYSHGRLLARALLGAAHGGAVGEHSLVLLGDVCYVIVGDRVAALPLPSLDLAWVVHGDSGVCFGLYPAPSRPGLVVHGELEISLLNLDGTKVWSFSGRDIFTGPFEVRPDSILATDFEGSRYLVDALTGECLAGAG